MLAITAQRLSAIIRRSDMVARLGGDEFAAIMADIEDRSSIEPLCTRIVQELRALIPYNESRIKISPSVGLALYPDDGESWLRVYKAADRALYRAKKNGRARWEWSRSDEAPAFF